MFVSNMLWAACVLGLLAGLLALSPAMRAILWECVFHPRSTSYVRAGGGKVTVWRE